MYEILKILVNVVLPVIHKSSTSTKMHEFNPKALIFFPRQL